MLDKKSEKKSRRTGKRRSKQKSHVRESNKTNQKRKESTQAEGGDIRLNRYIAQAGVCSRRKADELIKAGRVRLNGEVVTQMGIRVSEADVVEVGGKRITPLDYEYIVMNKPADTITTSSDDRGRKIVLDLIDDEGIKNKGVFPVGRLDRHTVGVLLITNDGEMAHRLMHPRYNIEKLYIARTQKKVNPHELDQMMRGIRIDGEVYKVDRVEYVKPPKKNELGFMLHEGKNRHIRRMLEALGHKTVYLERVNYAGITSEGIRRGKWRRLKPGEIKRLRRLVKLN